MLLDEFCRARNVTDFCRERYPDIVKMAIWLAQNEGVFSSPPMLPGVLTSTCPNQLDALVRSEEMISNAPSLGLYADEIDEINCQTDSLLCFDLSSREDMIRFVDISRELGLHVRALCDSNIFPVIPEDD